MHCASTSASLLDRLGVSDNVAWRRFEATYRPLILKFCRRFHLQVSDAEDVHQLVMMNLARSFKQFTYSRDRGRFRDYLYRVVMHAIFRHSRARRHHTLTLEVLDGHCIEQPTEKVWQQEWMYHHFRRAMHRVRRNVSEQSAEIFERLMAGQGVNDVAREVSMTPDAIKKIKQRLRRRLQLLIAEQVQDEDERPISALR